LTLAHGNNHDMISIQWCSLRWYQPDQVPRVSI